MEYQGEKITKKEGDRRSEELLEKAKENESSVFIFELNSKYDIDGNVPYNDGRFVNNSCDPNCEIIIRKGKIWIAAARSIKKGEELTYDYSYDLEDFEDYPCKCDADNCFGYMLDSNLRKKAKKILDSRKKSSKK